MPKDDKVIEYRLRVLAARKRRAEVNRMNEANLIERGAEGLEYAFDRRRAHDGAEIEAARRRVKSAHLSEGEKRIAM